MTLEEKKALYEAVMKNVSNVVKQHLNELSMTTIQSAYKKRKEQGNTEELDRLLDDYPPNEFDFDIKDKIIPIFSGIKVNCFFPTEYEDLPLLLWFELHSQKRPGKYYKYFVTFEYEITDDTNDGIIYYRKMRIEDWPLDSNLSNFIADIPRDLRPGLLKILSENDAKRLVYEIRKETGVILSYENFLYDKKDSLWNDYKNKSAE